MQKKIDRYKKENRCGLRGFLRLDTFIETLSPLFTQHGSYNCGSDQEVKISKVENIVGEGEYSGYQRDLLFQHCFQ